MYVFVCVCMLCGTDVLWDKERGRVEGINEKREEFYSQSVIHRPEPLCLHHATYLLRIYFYLYLNAIFSLSIHFVKNKCSNLFVWSKYLKSKSNAKVNTKCGLKGRYTKHTIIFQES